jgi:hypothetical protein
LPIFGGKNSIFLKKPMPWSGLAIINSVLNKNVSFA